MERRDFLTRAGAIAAGGVAAAAAPAAPAAAAPSQRVLSGLEVLQASGWAALAGQKVGVISNPTGVNRDYTHEVDLMHADDRVNIVAVFGPEHGFRGSAQAGGSEGTGIDPRTGLTIYDAHGATSAKFASMFDKAGVETVVFDIQDVGSRFYTYIWTMYRAMVAAAGMGLRFVVLDRPNPIGGEAYGPMMTPEYTSGVGVREIVQQHGMTVGELAQFFNGEFLAKEDGAVELEVIWAQGWRRGVFYDDTRLPWVQPSPNMPTPTTALVYPGTCMFEGVANISEGRGTTQPFEFVGAPDPILNYLWSDKVNAHGLEGVRFREGYFTPSFSKHTGKLCVGVEVNVVDRRAYDPIRAAVAMLVEARRYPQFAWRQDSWDPQRPYWIDKLSGSPRLRTMIDDGATVNDAVGAWSDELAAFKAQRQPYLHYPA